MTAAELIKRLREVQPDTEVYVRCPEMLSARCPTRSAELERWIVVRRPGDRSAGQPGGTRTGFVIR